MKKQLTIFLCLLLAYSAGAQKKVKSPDRLLQLRKTKNWEQINKNFDVVKVMLSNSRAAGDNTPNKFSQSFQFQYLTPRPYIRRFRPVSFAMGGNIGYKKLNFNRSKLIFANNQLVSIDKSDKSILWSKQRTGYIGVMLMSVIRLEQFTILMGPSLQHNLFSRYKEKYEGKGQAFSYFSKKSINRWSIPLQFQLSYSKRQFLSFGAFYSYDLKPLFKGAAFKHLRQRQFGLSAALII